jgi:glutathione S-transferase
MSTAGEGARMVRLYGRSTSGNSYKVRLLMAFLGMPCSETQIPLGTGGRNQVDQAYLTLNPRGQIPTLVDGDTVLWGSTGILVYLASRYDPSGTWLPCRDPATLDGSCSGWNWRRMRSTPACFVPVQLSASDIGEIWTPRGRTETWLWPCWRRRWQRAARGWPATARPR